MVRPTPTQRHIAAHDAPIRENIIDRQLPPVEEEDLLEGIPVAAQPQRGRVRIELSISDGTNAAMTDKRITVN